MVISEKCVARLRLKLPPQKPVDETSIKPKRKVNPDVVAVFDLDNEGWRSFRWDSITEFNTGA